LEGQDAFHMSGIHRDVYLYNTPKVYVADHMIDWNGATLSVNLEMSDEQKVTVTVTDESGTEVGSQTISANEGINTIGIAISNPQLWTAETPYLYNVTISQEDGTCFNTRYGLRTVKLNATSKQLTVNGKRVILRGVNSQDTDPLTGRTMSVEAMLKDVLLMKQMNVNCLRTSHYPRSPRMMAMLDYYGIYCVDEADVEAHKNCGDGGDGGILNSATSWKAQFVDRTERMVLRDRNHACVVMWSLGNETGNGANFTATYARTRELSDVPIHYEGASRAAGFGATANSDVLSRMYPSISTATSDLNKNLPYFVCEYAHAMGNAVGNLKEYWNLFYSKNNFVGACIWDFVDQAIYSPTAIKNGELEKNGYPYLTSGYDYPGPHQGNFVNNGILTADRKWTAKAAEVKAVYSPVQFSQNGSKISVSNKFSFLNLADVVNLKWSILRNGIEVESGTEAMHSVAALSAYSMEFPTYTTNTDADDAEYVMHLTAVQKDDTEWAEAGYALAEAEIILKERATLPEVESEPNGQKLIVSTEDGVTTIQTTDVNSAPVGSRLVMSVSESNGLTNMSLGAHRIASGAGSQPTYNNFRWIENDRSGVTSNGVTSKTVTMGELSEDGQQMPFCITLNGSSCPTVLNYTAYANGTIDMEAKFTPSSNDLRRIGLSWRIPSEWEGVEYYGRGPWENYVDRKDGAFLGQYTTTISDMFEQYTHPQTYGDHQDLRELRLTNDGGDTLIIQTEGNVAFSVSHYDETTFTASALHPWDLIPNNGTYVHFDYYQRGLGNGSCGQGTGTISEYYCPSGETYSFKLRFQVRRVSEIVEEKEITSIDQLSNTKAYTLYNAHYTTHAIYNPTCSTTQMWTAGTTGDSSHSVSNSKYSLPFDSTSTKGAWMIVKSEGNWYLYNIGAKKFVRVGQTGTSSVAGVYMETTPTPIEITEVNGGFAFRTETSGDKNYMCVSPQLSFPVSVWTTGDAGAIWQIEATDLVDADYETCMSMIPKYGKLTIDTRNGNIFKNAAGGALPNKIEIGKSFSFSAHTLTGYESDNGVIIRHGKNLNGPQYVDGKRQWGEYKVTARKSPVTTIPADSVDGDVRITAYWHCASPDAYELIFSDEFNGEGEPSADKWKRTDRYSATWNRWCSNSPLVVYEKNGSLHCLAIPNPDKSTDNVAMLTGGIKTQGLFGFQWGRAEARIKTNQWIGNFPAFWMMPVDNSAGWPKAGEIDIWETIDNSTNSWHTVHTNWTYNLGKGGNTQTKGSLDYSLWHVFAVEWNATTITWYVDNSRVWAYTKSSDQDELDQGQWPFDAPFYLILNQSVGNGAWAANADTSHTYETEFDWVRVYQPAELTNICAATDGTTANPANAPIYDLQGRKLNAIPDHGVYIQNGKKYIK